MKANFHLAGDLDVLVEPDETGKYVRLQTIRGVCVLRGAHQINPDGDSCVRNYAAQDETRHCDSLLLQRNEARAIASAIMGCAAEV